jgi:hypothetical protein
MNRMPSEPGNRENREKPPGVTTRLLDEDAPPPDPSSVNDYDSQTALLSFWPRPVHAMTDAFTAAGFRIPVISEPQPVPEAREIDPEGFRQLPANGCFLFFVLHAEPAAPER